jgi:hypothetical protein
MKLLALSAVVLLAGARHAQVFKCQQGDTTVYPEAPAVRAPKCWTATGWRGTPPSAIRMQAERLGRDRTVCRQVGTRIVCD